MEGQKPYFPADWQDDESMDVLFSPFRENREVNPQSWDRKMKFWTEMIFHECRFTKSAVIESKSLPHRFLRKEKTPVCLETVLQNLLREGKIERLSSFKVCSHPGWLSWGVDLLVKRPLSWTWGRVFGTNNRLPPNEEFIVTDMIKEQAEVVLERHYSLAGSAATDRLVEYTKLMEQMADICPEQRDLDLVLIQLVKDKKVTLAATGPEAHEKVVRFAVRNKRSVTPVSELELRILRLQKTELYLEDQVMKLSEEMERCRTDAKFYLQKGLRNSAKNALRRRRTLERIMTTREGALETIHGLIQRIREAESNKRVLEAYADGTQAFKDLAAETGLSTDNIDDVMTDMQEVFDIQQEIDASMAHGPADQTLDISTAELESELEAILAGDTPQESQAEEFRPVNVIEDDLPQVPTFDPSSPLSRTSPVRPTPLRQHIPAPQPS